MAADVLTRVQAEIDARLRELRPAVAEYAELLDAAGAIEAEARTSPARSPTPAAKRQAKAKVAGTAKSESTAKPTPAAKPKSSPLGAAERAIVAALEHGSHTVGELGVVTAMSGSEIRAGARRLLKSGKIKRAKREGKAAYALPDA